MSSNKQNKLGKQGKIYSRFSESARSTERSVTRSPSKRDQSSVHSFPIRHPTVQFHLASFSLSLSRALLPSAFHCSTCSTFFLTAYRRSLRPARCAPLFLLAALRAAMFARVSRFPSPPCSFFCFCFSAPPDPVIFLFLNMRLQFTLQFSDPLNFDKRRRAPRRPASGASD